jgi:hypothetical protein
MKYVTILVLSIFLISISAVAFADQPAQVYQPEQDIATETEEKGKIMEEAKTFPSTLMSGEEVQENFKQEVEEDRVPYVYDEDLSE